MVHGAFPWVLSLRTLSVQVRFDAPVCISGIKVGAAPGTAPKPAAGDPAPYVRLFGRKFAALPSAKFSVVSTIWATLATDPYNYPLP